MDIVAKALLVAQTAHNAVGQVRKYTGEAYWHHPLEVMQLVSLYDTSTDTHAAALLHDVVEDTDITIEFIKEQFGDSIAALVASVSEVSKQGAGNRAVRKAIDAAHYAAGSASAQNIKMADIICNITSIAEHDVDFAKVYLQEKLQILELLTAGNIELKQRAVSLVNNLLREIYLK